jgi:hypothetical protein
VALSGNSALVRAWYADNDTGAAYVFVRNGSDWTQWGRLTAADVIQGDHFGGSVALSGSIGLVGAGFQNHATGAAYVFSSLPAA